MEFIVTPETAGLRLDILVASESGLSRAAVQRLIAADCVTLNGKLPLKRQLVSEGDHISYSFPVQETVAVHDAPDLTIVYEDSDILVVDKPAGLLVHPGNGRTNEPTVVDFARLHVVDADPLRPGIVHRLDRETSGLLILAKHEIAKVYMQKAFAQREIHKTYRLLVVGRVLPSEAKIDLPIDRDLRDGTKRAVRSSGRSAQTSYRTVAAYPGYTYLEAEPYTGRTHQLRVHFAAIGHPIVGDGMYGNKQSYPGLRRHFLHAAKLSFIAPNGKELHLSSDLPSDLQTVLDRLDKDV